MNGEREYVPEGYLEVFKKGLKVDNLQEEKIKYRNRSDTCSICNHIALCETQRKDRCCLLQSNPTLQGGIRVNISRI